jgi:hypothetical protein
VAGIRANRRAASDDVGRCAVGGSVQLAAGVRGGTAGGREQECGLRRC